MKSFDMSYEHTRFVLSRKLKKHSIEEVVAFAEIELAHIDSLSRRLTESDKGMSKAFQEFIEFYYCQVKNTGKN